MKQYEQPHENPHEGYDPRAEVETCPVCDMPERECVCPEAVWSALRSIKESEEQAAIDRRLAKPLQATINEISKLLSECDDSQKARA